MKFANNATARNLNVFPSGFNAISVVFGRIKNVNKILEVSNCMNVLFVKSGERLLRMVSYPYYKTTLNFNSMTAFMYSICLRKININ